MLFYLLPLLASLSYNLPVSCLSDPDIDSLNLLPVHVRDWEHVLGKRHRKKVDFADIAPKDYARLIWGKDGVHANMLLHAQSGRDIVLLEAFEGLTQSIDCKGDDGSMSLTFKSKAAFEYALQHWSFINDDEEKDFLLIANHDGCGPDDQRQPYLWVYRVPGSSITKR